jgi:hypothetical protein
MPTGVVLVVERSALSLSERRVSTSERPQDLASLSRDVVGGVTVSAINEEVALGVFLDGVDVWKEA